MVNGGDIINRVSLAMTQGEKRKSKRAHTKSGTVRATVTFPSEIYQTLEDIARDKKVSLAWVVREASEQYIGDKWPLFKKSV